MVSTSHPLSLDLIKTELGSAYNAFSPAEQGKHLELPRAHSRPEDIALEGQARGRGFLGNHYLHDRPIRHPRNHRGPVHNLSHGYQECAGIHTASLTPPADVRRAAPNVLYCGPVLSLSKGRLTQLLPDEGPVA